MEEYFYLNLYGNTETGEEPDDEGDYYYYLAMVYDKIGKDKIQVCETLDLAIQMGIKDPTALQNAKILKEKNSIK